MFKIFSETQRKLLIATPVKQNKTKKANYVLCSYGIAEYTLLLQSGGIMRKYWVNARLKSPRANSKFYSSMPDVRGLRWFCPSSCGAYSILLFLGMLLFLICSSRWQMFHDPGITNILVPSVQSRLPFHGCMLLSLRTPMQGLPCRMSGLRSFPPWLIMEDFTTP